MRGLGIRTVRRRRHRVGDFAQDRAGATAVEFALVSVRRTRIETMAASGKTSARAVLRALDQLDAMLSASQFGITLASLALGAVGALVLLLGGASLLRLLLRPAADPLHATLAHLVTGGR